MTERDFLIRPARTDLVSLVVSFSFALCYVVVSQETDEMIKDGD